MIFTREHFALKKRISLKELTRSVSFSKCHSVHVLLSEIDFSFGAPADEVSLTASGSGLRLQTLKLQLGCRLQVSWPSLRLTLSWRL